MPKWLVIFLYFFFVGVLALFAALLGVLIAQALL